MKRNQIKIVFLGPDGCGKTTLIEYAKQQIEEQGRSVDIFSLGWKRFENPLLRLISKIYLKSSLKKRKQETEKYRLDRFHERSWFFYFLYYFELLDRYRKIKKSRKDFILIDRYFYEELMFIKAFKFKIFTKLTPRPDLCFVLKCPLNIIKKRGHDASQETLDNFYNHLEKLSKIFPMIFIDSSKSVDKAYKEVERYLNLNKKFKK